MHFLLNTPRHHHVVALKEEKTPFNNSDNFAIACTGTTFETLYKKKKRYLETKDEKYKKLYDAFKIVLRHGVVYARMAPEHKTLLVENFREEEFKVMMCGDGINDTNAMIKSDIGIGISVKDKTLKKSKVKKCCYKRVSALYIL